MPNDTRRYGPKGEDLAAEHLQRQGYRILERNYRTRLGEIDIVARHKDTLVFVEVKTRRSDRFGHPKLAVTPAKQRRISMVALAWLKAHKAFGQSARFDVVAIQLAAGRPIIEVIPNAFELAYS